MWLGMKGRGLTFQLATTLSGIIISLNGILHLQSRTRDVYCISGSLSRFYYFTWSYMGLEVYPSKVKLQSLFVHT